MAPHANLEIGSDGVAVITLTNPPVNALHPDCESPKYLLEQHAMEWT